jgi:predicted RNA polymerase sigma factor
MSDLGFEDFYESTRHRVVAFLYAIVGDRAEAQDVAQEAYARAWQRWNRVSSYGDPEAWVRVVGCRIAAPAPAKQCVATPGQVVHHAIVRRGALVAEVVVGPLIQAEILLVGRAAAMRLSAAGG